MHPLDLGRVKNRSLKMTRAEKAGQKMGKAIIEMACLMYKHCDIEDFYKGLDREIRKEMELRMMEK